jgi:DNA-binding transcriptional regulator YhcF (GntR family)
LDHWWHDHQLPFPTRKTLANRLGVDPRHVTRILNDLQAAGFIRKIDRRGVFGEQRSNFYDLSGTIEKLKALEPEFTKAKEDAKARRGVVETPVFRRGGRPK